MGCDIHCYIEYKEKTSDSWQDFGGRINPGRNYRMFGFMAGVRTDYPHIEPKGWPEDCASEAFRDNTIYVSESQESCYENNGDGTTYSKSHAEENVAKGYCQWIERHSRKSWVTNCDHHSHSWLSPDEFELAIAGYLKESGFQINTPRLPSPSEVSSSLSTNGVRSIGASESLMCIREYWAILSALRCFESQGLNARLVFWFDN